MGFISFTLGFAALVMAVIAVTLLLKGRVGQAIAVFVGALVVAAAAAAAELI